MSRRLNALQPLLCLAVVVLPAFSLATTALADDDKTYVGAECRSINSNDLTALDSGDGAMFNMQPADSKQDPKTQHQTWICPIVRDNVSEDPDFARITVAENGTDPANQVNCTFETRDVHGLNGVSATNGKRVVFSTNPLVVDITFGEGESLVLKNAPSHGYYYFRCDVPNLVLPQNPNQAPIKAGVIDYIVTEQ